MPEGSSKSFRDFRRLSSRLQHSREDSEKLELEVGRQLLGNRGLLDSLLRLLALRRNRNLELLASCLDHDFMVRAQGAIHEIDAIAREIEKAVEAAAKQQ